MSHELFGERFVSVRQPAWHGLGHVIEKTIKPSIAVKKFDLDFEVHPYPMVALVGKKQVKTGQFSLLRDPTKDDNQYRVFGKSVGENFEAVQNTEVAKILDTIHEVWNLETVGSILNGKTTFFSFRTGSQDIVGDRIDGYFFAVNTNDGGSALKLGYTPVRFQCKNTLVSGLRQATVAVNIQHLLGVKDQLTARVNLIAKGQHAIDETTKFFREMAKAKVTSKQAELIFDQVYPLPRIPEDAALVDYNEEDLGALLFAGVADSMSAFNYYTKQAQELRSGVMDLYDEFNTKFPKVANTSWAVYNSVVELADFRTGGKQPEVSALFGAKAREKKMAFRLASAFVK